MKSVPRYRSQLLLRRSYKPNRTLQSIRIRPVNLSFVFRPAGFGLKPQIKLYEYNST
jgi:hypothetical protein